MICAWIDVIDTYAPEGIAVLQGLEPVSKRPEGYVVMSPNTVRGIPIEWSEGWMTEARARERLELDEDDDLPEIARQNDIAVPKED